MYLGLPGDHQGDDGEDLRGPWLGEGTGGVPISLGILDAARSLWGGGRRRPGGSQFERQATMAGRQVLAKLGPWLCSPGWFRWGHRCRSSRYLTWPA
jgi:hypothetical protein